MSKARGRVISEEHAFGRGTCRVRCECGHINTFYLWSWAGHGWARCKSCDGHIGYLETRWHEEDAEADVTNYQEQEDASV